MALPALLDRVQSHLQEVRNEPSKSLDEKLLDHVDRQVSGKRPEPHSHRGMLLLADVYTDRKLSESLEESWRDTLLNQLSDLLPTLQQDPTPVTGLIICLVAPRQYDFARVLTIQPPVEFTAGLSSPLRSINLAVLALLEKAIYRKSDIDIVAGKADVVAALIRLWLCTPDTAVAGPAHDVIVGMMLADEGKNSMSDSAIMDEGLMWRRILRDRDIYGSIFSICSLSTLGQEGSLSKREKTVSQARLLDMLLKIDSNPVRTSQMPEIEQRFGVKNGGLLQFAATHMVDYRDDVLMHMTLIEFYANYLGTGDTFVLHFLRSNGLHTRSMAYYLEPEKQDPLDLTYLYGLSAKYLSTYCSTFPQDLLASPIAGQILSRLTQVLGNTHSSQWAQEKIPKHDLHVLVSLPRVTLIPRTQASSPFFLIPVKPANPGAFAALAHVLHGVPRSMPDEQAAARALYYLEMENITNFWECIVAAADMVALKQGALSALSLIAAIITANWSPLPDETPLGSDLFKLPSESELASRCHAESLPQSGIEAIMTQPALGIVIPYLMKPARSFGSLVGGGRGDVESAVYQIAAAKHDVLTLLHQKLKEWVETRGEGQEMVAAVGIRVAQGPMGGTSEAGGQVGTMEM